MTASSHPSGPTRPSAWANLYHGNLLIAEIIPVGCSSSDMEGHKLFETQNRADDFRKESK